MTIATYADLQNAVGTWLARADLAANIPDFITLAESRIFYGSDDPNFPSPPLRIRAMEQVTDPALYTTTAGVPTLALPNGFLEARAVSLATVPIADLDFVTQKQLNAAWVGTANGRPQVYTFQGDNLRFGPTPDAAYGVTLAYYQRFDPLAQTPTNWLIVNAPGVYLYAALIEAQPFIMSDQRLPLWAGMFAAATRSLMVADQQDRWGGQMVMRSDTGNP
ncbi:MAG TPA: hypothetical protein VFA50_13210 [Stellaceae bacterium]|nr:hypothetical protein [Stellaceae bacterium]